MSDTVRAWLVYRDYNDKGLYVLEYATTDGEHVLRQHKSPVVVDDVTAAVAVDPDKLEAVDDAATRERYATEASRMAERHDPDEAV